MDDARATTGVTQHVSRRSLASRHRQRWLGSMKSALGPAPRRLPTEAGPAGRTVDRGTERYEKRLIPRIDQLAGGAASPTSGSRSQTLNTNPSDPLVKSTFPGDWAIAGRQSRDHQTCGSNARRTGSRLWSRNTSTPPPALHVTLLSSMSAMKVPKVRRRFQQAGADDAVRTDAEALLAAEGNSENQVARRGERVAAANVGLAVEIRAESEVPLEAEDTASHEGNTCAPVELTGVERFRELLAGIAAEIYAKDGINIPSLPRRLRRKRYRDERNGDDSGSEHLRFSSRACAHAKATAVPSGPRRWCGNDGVFQILCAARRYLETRFTDGVWITAGCAMRYTRCAGQTKYIANHSRTRIEHRSAWSACDRPVRMEAGESLPHGIAE